MDGIKIKKYAYNLVCERAIYSKLDNFYDLHIDNLLFAEQASFASYIIANDQVLANEATSIDNPMYKITMLPALAHSMRQTTKNFSETLVEVWKDGIVSYLKDTMKRLISEALEEYNHELGYTKENNRWAA